MEYNIVTNTRITQAIKGYKNFTKSLGYASTTEQNNERVLSNADKFAHFYNKRYRATILGQGYIGDISVYIDYFIKDDQLAIYVNEEEFVYDFNWNLYKEKGIEWYLGHLLKQVDFELQQIKETKQNKKEQEKEIQKSNGDPYKLVVGHPHYNPGSVKWEDIKAYQEAKRSGLIK
jgi:hypothetical protein